jgi:uncharacterized protein (DUF1330 family)
MDPVYVVGQITIRNLAKWAEYRSQVAGTLAPWEAELLFRGSQIEVLAGQEPHADIVVIRFPNMAAVDGWYGSPAYQALIPLRDEAADVALVVYGASAPEQGSSRKLFGV